jgi:MoaA/NifB/PqqE/SkfB family radical SAM enzyme
MSDPVTFNQLLHGDTSRHCVHPWADLWISAAGNVTCCPQNRMRFGNIHEHGLEWLWNSPSAHRVRRHIANGDYVSAGCEPECPFLRGRPAVPIELPSPDELINLDFVIPATDSPLRKNLVSVVADYQSGRELVSGLPVYVDSQPVLRCNADCIMCTQPHQSTLMHPEPILKKLEVLKSTAKVFRWQGGEVFSNKFFYAYLCNFSTDDNPELIKYVITNGSLLTEARIAMLTNTDNPVRFLISLDGVSRTTFEKIRVGLNYRQVMQSLNNLAEIQNRSNSRDLVRWNYVVMHSTLTEMPAAIELAQKLGVDLNFAALQGNYPNENLFRYPIVDRDEALKYFLRLQQHCSHLAINVSGFEGMIDRLRHRPA